MKNTATLLAVPLALSLLAGCSPMQVKPLPALQADQEKASLLVYREAAFNAGAGGVILGIDGSDRLSLPNNSYTLLTLPAGQREVFFRTIGADRPFRLPVTLAANETRCLKAYPNPRNWAKAFLPITYLFGNTFLATDVTCPSEDTLKTFEKVDYVSQH